MPIEIRIRKQRMRRACKKEACEATHCNTCLAHTLGGVYCETCQIEDEAIFEATASAAQK